MTAYFKKDKSKTIGKKGRSENLILERNKAIIYRCYFYQYFTDWSYEAVMNEVSKDFFITSSTLLQLIPKQIDLMKNIKREKPSIHQIKKLFPQFNWSLNVIKIA